MSNSCDALHGEIIYKQAFCGYIPLSLWSNPMTSTHDKNSNEGDERAGVSLRNKLVAWWEGYDLSGVKQRPKNKDGDIEGGNDGGGPPLNKTDVNRFGKPLWSANRIEVVEKIWGEGFVLPGGADQIITLAKPLGLNPAMTVLDICCGLGGAARCLASNFGCWATGLESSPFLAEEGMRRSIKAGMSKQAPIVTFDQENLKYEKRVDVIFSKESLFTIKNKTGLFYRIEAILKPKGQFLVTDYIVEPGAINSKAIKSWVDREPLEPQLWTLQGALDAFSQCNLDLRVHEDVTEAHKKHIILAIRALTDHLEKHHLDNDTKVNVIDEVEAWAQRVVALSSGLKCYRFYAIKPAGS